MLEPFFFALGLVNSVFLILIFMIRRDRLPPTTWVDIFAPGDSGRLWNCLGGAGAEGRAIQYFSGDLSGVSSPGMAL